MDLSRVVITGIGLVTPVGLDRETTWQGLQKGANGIGPITHFDAAEYKSRFAAEVKGFDPLVAMDPKEARKADRFSQFAVAAAAEAIEHSGLKDFDPVRSGTIIGSGIGGFTTIEEQHERLLKRGPTRVSPMFVPMMISDMAAGLVSIRFGLKGPNFAAVSACASGAHAIASAWDQIALGHADVMVAGGSEAAVCPMAVAGFNSMKALSTRNDDPETASRPFDVGRDGFVLGEGSGIVVLESEEHAKKRGATIIAEVVSYGQTADAYHMTQPDNAGEGSRNSMRLAVERAGVGVERIGYINAHGTSTHFNDKIETKAIRDLFGAHADSLAVSSTKSMTGHLLGAGGAVECAVTALALKDAVLPPTINLNDPDPECDLDFCPHTVVSKQVEYALSNSLGFGGHNISLCLRTPAR